MALTAPPQPVLPLRGVLGHLQLSTGAPSVGSAVCAGHLEALGARPIAVGNGSRAATDGSVTLRDGRGRLCVLEWAWGDDADESIVQARSGLMLVHGRDLGMPRRLGLDVASVAAGVVASQGLLAALIARRRGLPVSGVETSVLAAGLLFLRHHVAIATSGDEFPYRSRGLPGPPFLTADGQWVEIEALSPEDWIAFWRRLGVERADVIGAAWLPFVYRYLAGSCRLPEALHEAVRRRTAEEVRAVAVASGVALSTVRSRSGPPPGAPWNIRPFGRSSPRPGGSVSPLRDAPLRGLVVLELATRLQGPLVGRLLGMLGADVVKVEPPGGDFGRMSPPLAGGTGAAYLAYNHGKRVVEVDYKSGRGRAEILELAADADVFLQNWPRARAEALRLDATDIVRCNPAVVYAHASGWGDAVEPPSSIAGDFLVQAHAGCGAGLHPPEQPPLPSRVTLVDVAGGLLACEGVLAGLYQRERTGRGCRVDTSLLSAALILQTSGLTRWGPLEGPVPTADEPIVVSLCAPSSRNRLCAVCGLPETARDEQIAARLRERPARTWAEDLHRVGVPVTRVCTDLADLPTDPLVGALLERVEDGCWVPGPPWRFS
jgi:crotonobetainyl-CoA:carnitine CoA-transferase CaiB-like acyl-CoA transferase